MTLLLQLNLGMAWGSTDEQPADHASVGWTMTDRLPDWTMRERYADWTMGDRSTDWTLKDRNE